MNAQEKCLSYFDLSREGDVLSAARSLFSILRLAENVKGAENVYLTDMRPHIEKGIEHADALFDRMFRAASGRFL